MPWIPREAGASRAVQRQWIICFVVVVCVDMVEVTVVLSSSLTSTSVTVVVVVVVVVVAVEELLDRQLALQVV